MRNKFNKTIAKEIALISFGNILDCVIGYSDPVYNLSTEIDVFEQNFIEDLNEKNILVTDKRIQIISGYFEKMRNDLIKKLRKQYYEKQDS